MKWKNIKTEYINLSREARKLINLPINEESFENLLTFPCFDYVDNELKSRFMADKEYIEINEYTKVTNHKEYIKIMAVFDRVPMFAQYNIRSWLVYKREFGRRLVRYVLLPAKDDEKHL